MPSLLRNLINAGEIGERCLRCHKLEEREYLVASKILIMLQFQQTRDYKDYEYRVDLWTLANCSFCRSCTTKSPKKVNTYYLELEKCITDELGTAEEPDAGPGSTPSSTTGSTSSSTPGSTPTFTSGSETGCVRSRKESQRHKERRTCTAKELEDLAQKIKQMRRDTDGFKKDISVLKQKLQTEHHRRELLQDKHKQLQRQHAQMVDMAATKYAEMIAEGTTTIPRLEHEKAELVTERTKRVADLENRNADLIAEGTTIITGLEKRNADLIAEGTSKIAELMQKITELELQNSWLQQQLQNKQTIDHTDIAKMVGTIKELNAGLTQCYGELLSYTRCS